MSGIIEAFKDIYTCEDALVKHISIFALCAIIGVVLSDAAAGLPKSHETSEVWQNLFSLNPILIFLLVIAIILLSAIYLMFTHNLFKRISSLEKTPILPYVDTDLIIPLIQIIPLSIVWFLYTVIGSIIPIFNIFWSLVIQTFCIPFVFIAYCKNFSTNELFSIKFVFDILPKIFLPMLIFYLKMTLASIAVTIPIFMISLLILSILPAQGITISLSIFIYFYYLLYLVTAYCQVYIYSENVYEINFDKNAY